MAQPALQPEPSRNGPLPPENRSNVRFVQLPAHNKPINYIPPLRWFWVGSGVRCPAPFSSIDMCQRTRNGGSCSDHRVPHAYDAQLTFQVTSVQRRPAATQELLDTVYRIGFPPRLSLHLPHTRPLSPTKGPSLRIQFPSTQASIR